MGASVPETTFSRTVRADQRCIISQPAWKAPGGGMGWPHQRNQMPVPHGPQARRASCLSRKTQLPATSTSGPASERATASRSSAVSQPSSNTSGLVVGPAIVSASVARFFAFRSALHASTAAGTALYFRQKNNCRQGGFNAGKKKRRGNHHGVRDLANQMRLGTDG